MTERDLGPGMRVLLGVLGAAALGMGVVAGAMQLRRAYLGSPLLLTLAAVAACLVIVTGGAQLLRGALRGRIVVRRQGRHSSRRGRGDGAR